VTRELSPLIVAFRTIDEDLAFRKIREFTKVRINELRQGVCDEEDDAKALLARAKARHYNELWNEIEAFIHNGKQQRNK
jgi:hypothetical protein